MLASLFARRYLFSAKSRSVINLIAALSVVAVAIPVAAMVILLSVTNGFEGLIHRSYGVFDAELQLRPRTGHTFPLNRIDTAALNRIAGVACWSAVLEQQILVETGGHQATTTLRGADDRYPALLPFDESVTVGESQYRLGELNRVVMGHALAYELGFRQLLGAKVNLYAVRRGSFSTLIPFSNYTVRQNIPVAGLFSVDYGSERDYLIAPLRLAQELLNEPDAVSALLLKTDGEEQTLREIETLAGDDFRIVSREELRASFYRLIRYERWGIFFIALMVLIVASFSVVGALSMLILEKRDDRRTLYALGATHRFVCAIFRREGYLICAIGGAIGLVTGILLCLAQQHFGLIRIPAESFLTDRYPVALEGWDLVLIVAATALIAHLLSTLTVHNMIKKETTI